jgi:inner membrane transporter RhtA
LTTNPQASGPAAEAPAVVDRSLRPIALVLGSMLSLQFGAAIATDLFDDVGPAGASALRLGLAAVVLWAWARPDVRSWSPSHRRSILLLGVALACMNAAFYEAVARLPLGAAITIEFLGPLGLAVALTRRLRDLTWVVLAVGGVVLLGVGQAEGVGEGLDPVGVAAALVAAVFWAGYILAGSRLATTEPGLDGLAGACAIAAVLVVPYGVASNGTALLDGRIVALGLAMAVLASVIPYSLEIRALEHLAKRTFSILVALEPAIGALVGLVLLGQRLEALSFVGVGLVVVAGIGATATAPPAQPSLLPESA